MPESAPKPRLVVGADHAGFRVKEAVKKFLAEQGYEVQDMGTDSEESVDYPDFARLVAEKVARGEADLGLLACGTGIGMAITANKVPGIRAAIAHDAFTARLARQHNNANVLAFGGRVVDEKTAIEIVREFLNTKFEGGRHQRRVDKIMALEAAAQQPERAARTGTK